jgi:hypothetical protein
LTPSLPAARPIPVCDEAYPNLEETFYATVAQLDETQPLIEVSDFFKGERYEAVATGDILVASLFQALYSAEIIPALPKMIYDTAAGDYQLLSLLTSNAISQQEFISHGMNTSVQCHEEVIFDTPEDADAAVAPFPELVDYFGDTTLDFALCDLWEAGSAADVENEPVSSDIPTLVLAGEYDPITPPAFGLLAAETLPNSYYLRVPRPGARRQRLRRLPAGDDSRVHRRSGTARRTTAALLIWTRRHLKCRSRREKRRKSPLCRSPVISAPPKSAAWFRKGGKISDSAPLSGGKRARPDHAAAARRTRHFNEHAARAGHFPIGNRG